MDILCDLVDLEDARLYYEEAGRGFPLVLLHSAAATSRLWDDQFTVFAREYRAIRYDLRGYGRSVPDPGPFSHVNDLHILLRLLEIQQAFLVGCGLGAHTIIDFALTHPRMTAGLVLVSPLPLHPATLRRLGTLRLPSIIITAQSSPPETTRAAQVLQLHIPGAKKACLPTVPGAAGHPNLARPDQFNRIVLTFLEWVETLWQTPAPGRW